MTESERRASGDAAVPPVESIVLAPEVEATIARFLERSSFGAHGGFVTDLDGTVVFEMQGTTLLAPAVEQAIKALYELGRPLMINSLRFPLSVMRTFGTDWYRLSNSPIPLVSLNGSQIGFIHETAAGDLDFDELVAFPLDSLEVETVFEQLRRLLDAGMRDVLLFYYPRDWRQGEIIWTPDADRVARVHEKYASASAVVTFDVDELREQLVSQELCMMLLLLDVPDDVLMAYQHTRRANFFTHAGVDKLSGTIELARRLDVDLEHSLGAGDTDMDRFLEGVGLALHVGPQKLPFRGILETIRLREAGELASVLFRLATLERDRRASSTPAVPR